MASSYTTNSGIEKPAQGDQTGEWGTTINTNMDIIDRSINGVLALSLSGTTTTLTTTDGTLTDGMYKVLVLGGSPSGTNTITVAPNDADKLYFVVNSSGQTATFTQGSGANVSVLNGDTAVIYCDGAGSGAAVADFTKDLGMSSVNIDGGTIDGVTLGTNSAITQAVIDNININGATIGHTSDTDLMTLASGIVTVAGEVSMTTLDIGGTNVTSTATELNKLDGATVTTTEINYLDITTLGTSEASKAVTVDSNGDLLVPDSDKFKFGAGSDMQLYHDGTNSYITNGTGILKIATETSGIAINIGHGTSEVTFGDNVTVTGDFTVNGTTTTINTTNLTVTDPLVKFGQGYTGTAYDEGFIVTRGNGSASNTANKGFIWDESADEFAAIACNTEDGTTAGNVTINSYADLQVAKLTGASLDISGDADIDGTLETDALSIASTVVTSTAAELNILDGVTSTTAELNYLDITTLGTTQASKAVTTDANGDVIFPDGDKIQLGTGSDLTIQHDGSNAYFQNTTGNINLQAKSGESSVVAVPDGAVTLYHDNAAKLATTAAGLDITGSVTITDADSGEPRILIVDTNADASAAHLDFQKDSASPADNDQVGIIRFISDNDAGQTTIVAQVIANITDVTDGTENGRLGFETMVDGTIAERMTLTGEGRVGIGATSPSKPLQVKQTAAGSGLSQTDIRATRDEYGADFSGYIDQGVGHGAIVSTVNNGTATERLRITNAGKVGIGTTTAENPLTIQDIGGSTFNRDFAIRNGDATNYHRLILGYNAASAASGVPTNAQFVLAEKGGGYGTSAGLVVGNSDNAPVMFTTNATERVRITNAGNVGIGTNNPSAQLQVHSAALGTTAGNTVDILQLHSPDTSNNTVYKFFNYRHSNGSSHSESELRWQRKVDVTNQGYIGLRNDAITFGYGDNTERARITSSGDFCFNSTALGFANQRAVQIQTSSTGLIAIQHLNTEGDGAAYIWFTHNGSAIGSIVQDGTSAIQYNASSDYRLKENVNYSWDATTRLKQLKPARFNFIADREKGTVDGFLAHEVSNVVPNAITGEKDAVDDDGKPIHQQIDHSKLVPLLVKTIQEQQTVIEALETRITALEAG